MATNFPGPYELRLFYSVTLTVGGSVTHEQRFNVDCNPVPTPGDPFGNIQVLNINGSVDFLDNVVTRWVAVLEDVLNSGSSTIDYVELWKYTPGTFLSSFVSVYPIGVAGTSSSATQVAGQSIFVFRTQEGGIMKMNVLEGITASVGVGESYPTMSTANKALSDTITDPDYPATAQGAYFLARDTSYPFTLKQRFPGQNEAIYKRRYRP
jgi:hypothetical protein